MISEVFIIVMPLMFLLMYYTEFRRGQSKENKDSNREFSRTDFFFSTQLLFARFFVCLDFFFVNGCFN